MLEHKKHHMQVNLQWLKLLKLLTMKLSLSLTMTALCFMLTDAKNVSIRWPRYTEIHITNIKQLLRQPDMAKIIQCMHSVVQQQLYSMSCASATIYKRA